MRLAPGVVLALMAGCAAPLPPKPKAAVRIQPPPGRTRPAIATASPGEELQVKLPPGTLHCGASTIMRCDLSVPLTLTNLGVRPVTVPLIELRRGDMTVKYEPDPRTLAQGKHLTLTLREFAVGTQKIVVHYRVGSEPTRRIVRVVNVDNPERERREAACRACNGDWGAHGITGYEGCNCRMPDAGKECHDGTDCKGECLFDHVEEVRPASQDCSHGACSVTLREVRMVGRCATFRTTFGCHSFVPDGESKHGPLIGSVHAPTVCVD